MTFLPRQLLLHTIFGRIDFDIDSMISTVIEIRFRRRIHSYPFRWLVSFSLILCLILWFDFFTFFIFINSCTLTRSRVRTMQPLSKMRRLRRLTFRLGNYFDKILPVSANKSTSFVNFFSVIAFSSSIGIKAMRGLFALLFDKRLFSAGRAYFTYSSIIVWFLMDDWFWILMGCCLLGGVSVGHGSGIISIRWFT